MQFPQFRARRTRRTEAIRSLVRETCLTPEDLIYPLFVQEGSGIRTEIEGMPAQYRYSTDQLKPILCELRELGIPGVVLFGIPAQKDSLARQGTAKNGIVPRAVQTIKETFSQLLVFTDVCACAYTDHGHCGIWDKGSVDNDATLELLAEMALVHAKAGADFVAPSDMMDGRVGVIREALDEEGYHQVGILAYSAKYASSFYGPFRAASDSAPEQGDRSSYQLDPANAREALLEASMDAEEGADILMVKPALPCLDIIATIRDEIDLPLAAYNVSGEYAMLKAAAARGWIDGDKVMMESLTAIKRAGASFIVTYHAPDAARLLSRR